MVQVNETFLADASKECEKNLTKYHSQKFGIPRRGIR